MLFYVFVLFIWFLFLRLASCHLSIVDSYFLYSERWELFIMFCYKLCLCTNIASYESRLIYFILFCYTLHIFFAQFWHKYLFVIFLFEFMHLLERSNISFIIYILFFNSGIWYITLYFIFSVFPPDNVCSTHYLHMM